MITREDSFGRSAIALSGIIALGMLVGLAVVVSTTLLRPVVLAFAVTGIVLSIPTLVVRDPKAYWLFLLGLSLPIEIGKRMTAWIADPFMLLKEFGPPATGTLSVDIYLTDVLLLPMLLPWLVRLALRQEECYFPKIGYVFLAYLGWGLFASLIESASLNLSMFELCRQLLYFLAFVYLVNNVKTDAQLRAIVIALFIGLAIAAVSVIAFALLGLGTDYSPFHFLYAQPERKSTDPWGSGSMYTTMTGGSTDMKRSAGIFPHPALAACFINITLCIVLAYLTAARRWRDLILFGVFIAAGCVACFLTFSRGGLIALIAGIIVVVTVGRWSGLISKNVFASGVFLFVLTAAAAGPVVASSLMSRPETVSMRWTLTKITLEEFSRQPILGSGLNNSSSMIKDAVRQFRDPQSVPGHYLVVLTEAGIPGFMIFFGFLGQLVLMALHAIKTAETQKKILLVGIVGALASILTQNFADNVFGGRAINATFWVFAALIVLIAREVQARNPAPVPGMSSRATPIVVPRH
jgi:hypothetical protein